MIHRSRNLEDIGRVKLEKANQFAETHCGVPLERDAIRWKQGPVDLELLKAAEHWAEVNEAFSTLDPGNNERVQYSPGYQAQ